MRFNPIYLALGGAVCGVALWYTLHRPADSHATAPRDKSSEHQRAETKTSPVASAASNASPHAPAQVSEQRSAQAPPLSDDERLARQRQAYDAIEAAAITYDAKSLPLIEPYLSDPDRLIRDAAVQGMIANGDASAATYLRAAATKTPDPREAAAMLDAADYVELPSASLLRKNPPSAQAPPSSAPATPPPASQSATQPPSVSQ